MNTIIVMVGGAIISLGSLAMGLPADWRIPVVVMASYVLGRISETAYRRDEQRRLEPK